MTQQIQPGRNHLLLQGIASLIFAVYLAFVVRLSRQRRDLKFLYPPILISIFVVVLLRFFVSLDAALIAFIVLNIPILIWAINRTFLRPLAVANSRVEPAVDDVDNKVDDHKRENDKHD